MLKAYFTNKWASLVYYLAYVHEKIQPNKSPYRRQVYLSQLKPQRRGGEDSSLSQYIIRESPSRINSWIPASSANSKLASKAFASTYTAPRVCKDRKSVV